MTAAHLRRAGSALAAMILVGLALHSGAARAADLGVDVSTDLRRRGIGWSDGKPAIEAFASVPLTGGLSVDAGAATLRASPRHGGAAALTEVSLRYGSSEGAWQLWGEIVGHGFIGGDPGSNYAEVRGGGALSFGPAQLSAQAGFAPRQAAIGGSNLALGARAALAILGTPLTLAAGAGYSTGSDDGTSRSNRLRPGGAYGDLRLDADYAAGPITIGISLVTTTIDGEAAIPAAFAGDTGTRLLLRAGMAF